MGYWISKDSTNWVARVHRGDSSYPTNAECRWDGAKEGKPAPLTWEYVKELPTRPVMVMGRTIPLTPCYDDRCMNGGMHP
jgi:hypothetical protein